MASSITLSSSSKTSPPRYWSSDSNSSTAHRDASFSSYLTSSEENFIHKLVQSNQVLMSPKVYNQQDPVRKKNYQQGTIEDGEIDVFSAEKYFNGKMDDEGGTKGVSVHIDTRKGRQQYYKDEAKALHGHVKLKFQPKTPSVRSVSSSNSQSALLRNIRMSSSRKNKVQLNTSTAATTTTKDHAKNFFANLGCSCTCTDRKSLDIDGDEHRQMEYARSSSRRSSRHEQKVPKSIKRSIELEPATKLIMVNNKLQLETWAEEDKQHANSSLMVPAAGENHFEFPHSTSTPKNTAEVSNVKIADCTTALDNSRKPLQVFGFKNLDEEDKNVIPLDKRLNMLSWDAIPTKVEELDIRGPPSERDSESEASSDLFEIDCLSCQNNPVLLRQESLLDDCFTPTTTCYAPSEASIDWSVVTASAADFSTGLTDTEDARSSFTAASRRKMVPVSAKPPKMLANNNQLNRLPGILSGCKSHKAVRVAGDHVYRPPAGAAPPPRKAKYENHHQRVQRSDSFSSLTRFHTESKLNGFGISERQQDPLAAAGRVPAWTRSGHSSDLVYI